MVSTPSPLRGQMTPWAPLGTRAVSPPRVLPQGDSHVPFLGGLPAPPRAASSAQPAPRLPGDPACLPELTRASTLSSRSTTATKEDPRSFYGGVAVSSAPSEAAFSSPLCVTVMIFNVHSLKPTEGSRLKVYGFCPGSVAARPKLQGAERSRRGWEAELGGTQGRVLRAEAGLVL